MRTARSEAGLSLIEALVATAVMCVAVMVALLVYDASRAAFAKSENATEQQESVRIAFDRLTTELRMLGYNFNPDGNLDRPDEQLEGALDRAIVFRADFDRTDPVAFEGGAFTTVSTGNDEIVAYVLSKPDGTGPDSITFQADVREAPRDGVVEPVTINNIVLNPTAPPYTLYRVTLNNDSSTYGSPSFIVRTPVAENIRDLKFTYYGDGGAFSDPSTSIGETALEKAARGGLTRVNVSLIGMTHQQDRLYNDPSDPVAPGYRKFELRGDVTPRNMRWKGTIDLNGDVTPPSKPAKPTLIQGHCGGLLVSWASNPSSEGVTQYRVSWGSAARSVSGSPYFLAGLTTGSTYSISIQAQDAQGNMSAPSDPESATVSDSNVPGTPTGFTTSTDQTYHVAVSWGAVTTNTTNDPSADPMAPRIRDLAGYRLYWTADPPGPSTIWRPVADEHVLGPSSSSPYLDTPLIACLDRYYRMTAVDTCQRESAPTPPTRGVVANAGVLPKPPTNVQAHFNPPGNSTVDVKWSDITKDVNDQAIRVQRYEVFQSDPVDDGAPPISWSAPPFVVYSPPTEWPDAPAPNLPPGKVVYYRVEGGDYCGNRSDFSDPAKLSCTFAGDVEIQTPAQGATVSGNVPVKVVVTSPSGNYDHVKFTYLQGGVVVRTITIPGGLTTTWTDAGWTAAPVGAFTIVVGVEANNCWETATIDVTAAP